MEGKKKKEVEDVKGKDSGMRMLLLHVMENGNVNKRLVNCILQCT